MSRAQTDETAPMRVLLVEDSPTDAELVAAELEECPFAVELDCVEDAEAALARLRAPSPPDLILLDLGLPGRDGASLLAELRAAETTATLPVIVLSTSQAQHDILATHDLHADGYISKPLRVDEFVFTVMRLRAGQARHSE